jgi:hypothetical protein
MSDGLLFDVPEAKSPRLRWIERFQLRTMHYPNVAVGDEDEESGDDLWPWVAWQYQGKCYPPRHAAGGATEDDALAEWARRNRKLM